MPIIAPTVLDLMEYATDAAAKAAYIANPKEIDAYFKLVMHGDGEGQAIVDSSPSARDITNTGAGITQSADQSVFGGKSIYFPGGTANYLTLADSDDWNFGSATDFTIAWWWRPADITRDLQHFIFKSPEFVIRYRNDHTMSIYNWVVADTPAFTPVNNTWVHLALARSGSTLKFFVNGVGETITNMSINPNGWVMGSDGTNTLRGYIDEFIITKGLNLYPNNFSVPTGPFSALTVTSESTIKQEGSYSLKGLAVANGSLNSTETRTVSPVVNLTDKNIIKFDMRASRTGSNIKIGIHDSGGTTTEITPAIVAADTWQTVVWDISAVANANKDAIDSIIVTIVNADAENTFYIDNMFGDTINNYLIHRGRDRFRMAGISLGN